MEIRFDEPQDEFYVSFSRLNYFCSCPRKYYLKYIEKVPQPESLGLISGKSIHRASASGYKKMIDGKKITPNETADEAVSFFEEEFNLASNTVGVEKPEGKDDEKNIVALAQKKYATDVMAKKKPLEVESGFNMKFADDGLLVKGYADLIEKQEKGLCLTEIKTSAKRQSLIMYSPQVLLYQKAKNINSARIEFILKKKTPEIQVEEITSDEDDYQEILHQIKGASESLKGMLKKEKPFWYKNSGFWCGMCWYKSQCYKVKEAL